MTKKLTISTIAKEIGISVETIRYYERIGLISQPEKPDSGYRIYHGEILEKLHFIKRAKKLGFSLNEISDIITERGQVLLSCDMLFQDLTPLPL